MKKLLSLILPVLVFTIHAQEIEPDYPADKAPNKKESILNFAVVEKVPLAFGCKSNEPFNNELAKVCLQEYVINHIAKNFKFPKKAIKLNVEAKIFVRFVIEKNASISSVEIVRGAEDIYKNASKKARKAAKALDNEAIRVIQSLVFEAPATQRGKPVRMSFTVPINAKL